MVTTLFEMIDSLVNHQPIDTQIQPTIDLLLEVVGRFLLHNPQTEAIARLFTLCYSCSATTASVARTLNSIMGRDHFDPGESLLFPQLLSRTTGEETGQESSQHDDTAASLILDGTNGARVSLADGLTLSLWIKLVKSAPASNKWLHIATIGNDQTLSMRVELRPSRRTLRVR